MQNSFLCKSFLAFVFLTVLSTFSEMKADHRNFVWTYEYMIMEPNEAEIETYNTVGIVDLDSTKNTTSNELNLEFEIGMNDFWDVAFYQNFKQSPGGSLKYDGFKIRNRFKIGKKDQFFLDPLIYIEYIGYSNFAKHKFEPKLILAKTLGKFTLALNPYAEFEYENEEWEFVPKYALGASYGISRILNIGLEMKGDKDGNYFGPTISHGSKEFWFALGTLFKVGEITTGKPELQSRLIMGLKL